MSAIASRASGLWQQDARMSTVYYAANDGDSEASEEQQSLLEEGAEVHDSRTPLDRTIDRIGMGSYQWTLLSLCGFGWMADNMWIQAMAIILPRVQRHYSVPDNYIGALSSSMFAGMMVGAVGWGTCSDLMGRITAFNATLFFTALFGILASFASSFRTLCIILFFLGSAVGGSMPTDGTLLLEHMPKEKQYMVTALSVFFSFGAVLAAVVALLVVPQNSCPVTSSECDVDIQNQGWKYLLVALGLITLTMFLARIVFFRLHESPRYLVHAGRPQEALESLQMISRFNGSEISIYIEDVRDHHHPHELPPSPSKNSRPLSPSAAERSELGVSGDSSSPDRATSPDELGARKQYHATGESPVSLENHTFATPVLEQHSTQSSGGDPTSSPVSHIRPSSRRDEYDNDDDTNADEYSGHNNDDIERQRLRRASIESQTQSIRRSVSVSGSLHEKRRKKVVPKWIRKPMKAWWERVLMVLSPEWFRTTILVWAVWFAMSLAYTMFNVFLPKLLETRPVSSGEVNVAVPKSLEASLWEVVIFTIGGCPGAILGAYMIESSLGRRWSLAGSTFVTAAFCFLFISVKSTWAVQLSTVGISLSATTMYAILYGWTPEIFATKVRGTACGIASALSRVGGMVAPITGGILLTLDRAFPVYTSVVVYIIGGVCVLLLREGEGDSGKGKGGRAFVH
ncbi:hypothetical protein AX16_008326 [Volvariella volvacea WC 439]|nr:hypothetical protein AX16_008326 [Volvariella volvacea WC 439]